MHKSSKLRMQYFVKNYVSKGKKKLKVLDVGSYDVNGSYRDLFSEDKFEYLGLDMVKGPNVDVVFQSPYLWKSLKTDSFDIVISGQALEHSEFFWLTMSEMTRVLKKGGLICIILPRGFREHRYPVDCYRFFTDGMVALARYVCLDILHAHTNCIPNYKSCNWYSTTMQDSMLIAEKKYSGDTKYVDKQNYICKPENHNTLKTDLIKPSNYFSCIFVKWMALVQRMINIFQR